jgi:hypothetical protein
MIGTWARAPIVVYPVGPMGLGSRHAAAFVAALALAAAGCAVASDDLEGVTPSRKDGGAARDVTPLDDDAGEPEDGGASGVDASTPGADAGAGSVDAGSATDTGAGVETGPSGTPCTTLGASECASSFTDLGSISGDKGSGVRSGSGGDSRWFHVFVSEDDASVLSSVDLRVRVTLSPSKGNFDLYVYRGKPVADGGAVECSTPYASSTNPTGDDMVALKWNDNRPIGGSDDGRTISIEVRATDAVCTDATWTLRVEGNK